jgi:parallel beta-helix repeat protein
VLNVNIADDDECGIYLLHSDNNTVANNLVNNCAYGIKVWYSNDNRILQNVVKNCDSFGIVLHGPPCAGNEMGENILINNGIGIHLGGFCTNDVIERNTLINNGIALSTDWFGNVYRENSIIRNGVGFYQFGSSGNRIFHNNFVGNKQQVLPPGKNVWDDGYPSGGNYWSNYNGSDLYKDPFQNETGSDGIGDSPYIIDEKNKDTYPLMKPWISYPSGTIVNASIKPSSTAFNLRCKGGWICVYVKLPKGHNVGDIDASTVRIEGKVACDPTFLDASNGNADGLPELELKFNRTTLAQFMNSQNLKCCTVSLMVTGQLYNLLSFNGTVSLQISNLLGDIDCDGKVTDHDVSLLALAYGSRLSDPNWNGNADINGDGTVDLSDLVTLAQQYG